MTIPGFGPLATSRMGCFGVITSVAADDGCQDGLPCVPKLSWGILGQMDTRGLSQGIPDLEDLRCGATGTLRCGYSVVCYCYGDAF